VGRSGTEWDAVFPARQRSWKWILCWATLPPGVSRASTSVSVPARAWGMGRWTGGSGGRE
jgi:hypothetical protein